jgi:alpha-1,2-mannosyltransferase
MPAERRESPLTSEAGIERALAHVLLAVVVIVAALTAVHTGIDHHLGSDFKGTVWEPARAVLDGRNPYPPATPAGAHGQPAVYPPTVFVAAIPLAVLPFFVAAAIWTLLLVAAVALSLWLLDVRDWRCYAAAGCAAPAWGAITWGNASIFVLLALSVVWRYRDQDVVAGVAAGSATLLKLFPWPVLVWLLLTRRWRAAAIGTAGAAVLALVSWAAIGFEGFASYPRLLRELAEVQGTTSLSFFAVLKAHGAGSSLATVVAIIAAGAVLTIAMLLVQHADGDRRSFSLAIVAALLATPVVWPHYFAPLIIVVATLAPRFGPVWLLVLCAPPVYRIGEHQSGWLIAASAVLVAATVLVSERARAEAPSHATPRRTDPEAAPL